ncbi:Y-family DNA polymerase [Fontivita pretiosa]|uniref:Y-family DNA polymerase n=1 Tax=Fontivita pretiosa TaxID=2989684 RepID=UPI003D1711DA
MKNILCVLLTNWPIDRLRRQIVRSGHRHDRRLRISDCGLRANRIHNPKSEIRNPPGPLVLVRTIAGRQQVVAVSGEARDFGIRVGMTLAQARALCAHLAHAEHDPHRDAAALEALGRWMMRFSPVVAIEPGNENRRQKDEKQSKTHPSSFLLHPCIFLDLSGCERVFGGLENILRQISDAMRCFNIGARLAVAPTPGAAWALAFAGHSTPSSAPGSLPSVLAPLPPIALRISPDTAAALHHLGIDTIGQLMCLPRSALPARFGEELLMRLDQALGRIPEPLVPLEHFWPIEARMDFDGPVDSLEAIWAVFRKLITQVVAELHRRGHGARELEVEFFRPYAATLRRTIHLSRPSRQPGNLFNLLRCAMENIETDTGFLGIRLVVARSQRISEEQIDLAEDETFAAEAELAHLIERLRIRLGDRVILQPCLVESYVPEKACHAVPALDLVRSRTPGPCYTAAIRPLHLLNMPEQIGVIVSPSHDCEGRCVCFTWRGRVHRVIHSVGPERIAGQWWQGHHKTRDYFDVEDETGKRYWIFRVTETRKWYVHGEFE